MVRRIVSEWLALFGRPRFPKVFYVEYALTRNYFPLMAFGACRPRIEKKAPASPKPVSDVKRKG